MKEQSSHLGRREFLAAAATSGVGISLPAADQPIAPNRKVAAASFAWY